MGNENEEEYGTFAGACGVEYVDGGGYDGAVGAGIDVEG